MERSTDEGGEARDRSADGRASPARERPGVGQALREPHADRRAERCGESDEERGAGAREIGRRKDRREGGQRPVDQPDQPRLDNPQHLLTVALASPSRDEVANC